MLPPRSELATHDVANQPPEPGPRDLWAEDPVLRHWAARAGADAATLARQGRALGPPELALFDRGGRRLDEVRYSAGYHRLMALGLEAGYAACAWDGGSHATHAALVHLHSQVEPGSCCPMTMTYAGIPALAADPVLAALWQPKLTRRAYDSAVAPIGDKRAATLGMAMTEKQGGSDVRANATRAEPADGGYRLTGHKWFCSAPMSDGFLTLAQAPGGLTCFLVPRWLEGARNAIHLMRLKDKLGNRANASAEIEYHGAVAHRLGDEGEGVRTIIRMVHHTRLDTAMAPAGLMRAALAEAHRWAAQRTAFQRRLIDQPLMRSVLAELALDLEAATALAFRTARAFDREAERPFARIAVALAKFLNNKLCPNVTYEAMEVLGGMGYVADTALPMLYREAPLNGIWEGAGNVICLDILRTLGRDAEAAAQLAAELDAAQGADRRYDAALGALRARWPGLPDEAEARAFAERTAWLLAASVQIREGVPAAADGLAARLDGASGRITGTATGLDTAALIARLAADT